MNIERIRIVRTHNEWWDLVFRSEPAVDLAEGVGARNGRFANGTLYLIFIGENNKIVAP